MNEKLKLMTKTGVFAALICALTMIHIPIGTLGGYVHVGDSMIYLAASVLPMPYAMAAAAIGGGLADTFAGAAVWILATVIIKPLNVLCFTRRGERILSFHNAIGAIVSGVVTILGYCIAEALITGNWVAPFVAIPAGLAQPVGSAVVYLILAFALDRAGLKKRLMV